MSRFLWFSVYILHSILNGVYQMLTLYLFIFLIYLHNKLVSKVPKNTQLLNPMLLRLRIFYIKLNLSTEQRKIAQCHTLKCSHLRVHSTNMKQHEKRQKT